MTRGNDLVDKGRPVMGPLLLQYRDEDEVQLVQEGAFAFQFLFGFRMLDDQINDEISNSYILASTIRAVPSSTCL